MYLISDVGCWADGARGYAAQRVMVAEQLEVLHRHHPRGGDGLHWGEVKPICDSLRTDMSDDDSEMDDALEWLNEACEDGCHFEFIDGDLMLMADDEDQS